MQLHKNSHNATLQSHYKSIRNYGEKYPEVRFYWASGWKIMLSEVLPDSNNPITLS